MFNIKLWFMLSVLSLATTLHAQTNDLTGLTKIKSIQVLNHGGFILNFEKTEDSACVQKDGNAIFIFPNHNGVTVAGAKSLLSTALIAYTGDLDVNVLYSFSLDSSYCWGSALYLSK